MLFMLPILKTWTGIYNMTAHGLIRPLLDDVSAGLGTCSSTASSTYFGKHGDLNALKRGEPRVIGCCGCG